MRNENNLLSTITSIRLGISTKTDDSMKKTDGTVDLENIKKFLKEKKLSEQVVCMEQVHGGKAAVVSDNKLETVAEVDGLITTTKGLSLAVLTADCLPLLLHDSKKGVIGAAHAGSKGLLKKIIHNTIGVFKTNFASDPQDIIVSIGPSIEKSCYEVGSELIAQFEQEFEWFDTSYFAGSNNNRYLLDLRKIALQSLIKEGILREHIEISSECTKCSVDTLYSYRGGDKTGRFVSVISLE